MGENKNLNVSFVKKKEKKKLGEVGSINEKGETFALELRIFTRPHEDGVHIQTEYECKYASSVDTETLGKALIEYGHYLRGQH